MKIAQMQPWYGEEEIQAVNNYMRNGGWLTDFDRTRELERMIAEFTGSKYCSVVSSGTIGLQIALMALGIGRGDKVIVPSYTHPATPYSVELVGAGVVLCDIEKDTFNFSPEKLWDSVKKYHPTCIMHVSIDGRSCPIEEITKLYKNEILLVEDAAQSLGSFCKGKHLGTFGDIGMLSLNTFKIISCGQSGILLTDNEKLYNKIIRIKDYGRAGGRGSKYEMLGVNAKANDLLSVIAIEQMKKLEWRVEKKKQMFKWYVEFLRDVEQVRFIPTNLNDCAPWYIDPLVENRDELIKYLAKDGIETQPFYPPINHILPYYDIEQWSFPNAEYISEHGIWLPSSSFLEKYAIEYICSKIKEFYR